MEYYSKSSFLKSQNHSLKSYYISLLYFRCYKSCNIYDIVTKYSNFLRKKIAVQGIPRNLHSKIFRGEWVQKMSFYPLHPNEAKNVPQKK